MADAVVDTIVLWPLAIPILTAALCACLWLYPAAQRTAGWFGLALTLMASILLLVTVSSQGVQAMQFGSWAAPFGITFVADRFSAAMVLIAGLLAIAVSVFGICDIRRKQELGGFHPFFHGLLASVNGAFLTGDIFNLYVWFEVMLITALGLIILDRTKAQLDGALKYAALNLFATLLILMAVALLYGVTGTLNMADLAVTLPETEASPALTISAMLLLAGFGIKAGFFPVFFWLPASYHTIPIVVSALFAGLLTKVGVYACFRIFTLLFEMNETGIRSVVAVIAAATMLFGVFGAAVQWDVRRILSFHIISQIGYILLGLAISTQAAFAGAIFYIVHHIIVKANLFLVAGAIHRATGSYDLRQTGGLMAKAPLLAVLFLVPAMSLAGIPPLSGFWAKFMVIDASLRDGGAWLAAVALFVGLMTVFSMSKIWIEAFWKTSPRPGRELRPIPSAMVAAIVTLGAVTLTMSLYPEPFVRYAELAAEGLTQPADYIAAVLGQAEVAGGAR